MNIKIRKSKDKTLKKLKRDELLEMLLAQTQRVEELEKKVSELEEKLKNKEILIRRSGSIAEAALGLNKVFEAAQAAADQYLENVTKTMLNIPVDDESEAENK